MVILMGRARAEQGWWIGEVKCCFGYEFCRFGGLEFAAVVRP
jgi:hypothetical protein